MKIWRTFGRRQARDRFHRFSDPPGNDQRPTAPKPMKFLTKSNQDTFDGNSNHCNSSLKHGYLRWRTNHCNSHQIRTKTLLTAAQTNVKSIPHWNEHGYWWWRSNHCNSLLNQQLHHWRQLKPLYFPTQTNMDTCDGAQTIVIARFFARTYFLRFAKQL